MDRPGLVVVVVALGAACGSSSPPTARAVPPSGAASSGAASSGAAPAAPSVPTSSSAPSAPSAPSVLQTFDAGDLTRVTIAAVDRDVEPACAVGDGRTWILSASDPRGEGATCIGDGQSEPACVMYAGATPEHVVDVMCRDRTNARVVAVPAWAPRVLAALRATPANEAWSVTPIMDAGVPASAIVVDDELFMAVRTPSGWRRSVLPLEEGMRLRALRIVDTSALTSGPSYGVTTSAYDGGSETGTERTSFTILTPTDTGLQVAARIQTGQFTWVLAAEDRRRHPKAATDMMARPHVDVQLAPRVDGNVLVLEVARAELTRELAGTCKRASADELDAPCILADLKATAGRYALVGTELRRAK